MLGPTPQGPGEFNRWMIKLSIIYALILLASSALGIVLPIIQGQNRIAVITGAALNLVTIAYFVIWIPALRTVMRNVKRENANLCYDCGYPGILNINDTCTECGHVQTKQNKLQLHRINTGDYRTTQLPHEHAPPTQPTQAQTTPHTPNLPPPAV